MVKTLDDSILEFLEQIIADSIGDAISRLEHNAKKANDWIPSLNLDKQPSYQQAINSLKAYCVVAINKIKEYRVKMKE